MTAARKVSIDDAFALSVFALSLSHLRTGGPSSAYKRSTPGARADAVAAEVSRWSVPSSSTWLIRTEVPPG